MGMGTDGSEMRTEHVDVEWDWYWNSDRDGLGTEMGTTTNNGNQWQTEAPTRTCTTRGSWLDGRMGIGLLGGVGTAC